MRWCLACLWMLAMPGCEGGATPSRGSGASAAVPAVDGNSADRPSSAVPAAGAGGGGEQRASAPASTEPQDGDPGDGTPDEGGADEMPEDRSGQTTSIGASAFCEPEQCAEQVQHLADTLSAPASWWRTFTGGRCVMTHLVGVASGYACQCQTGTGGSLNVGPVGAGCYAFGRAGDCLWGDDEFSGCDPLVDPCGALCEEFEARFRADAETSFDVTVRHSECRDGHCRSVLRIGDACYAGESYERGLAYSCELDDAEIIARFLEDIRTPPPPECGSPGDSGGTCAEPADPAEEDCAPRDPQEWQGLKVCGPHPPCDTSSRCGLARACIEGRCVACRVDQDCAPFEGCVLDHCVPEPSIECRSASECPGDAVCYLTGYTGGTARGNETMKSICLQLGGGG